MNIQNMLIAYAVIFGGLTALIAWVRLMSYEDQFWWELPLLLSCGVAGVIAAGLS